MLFLVPGKNRFERKLALAGFVLAKEREEP
jgi:hypothetical protein